MVVAILELVGVKLPDKVLTFTWPQILATWGISAARDHARLAVHRFGRRSARAPA